MTFDSKVPAQLKLAQQWFGSIIGRPIDEDSRINPISPSGNPIEMEAAEIIAPSPTLRPAQRIQIYNQQYWWRLLNILHEAFPSLTRVFGYYEFNRSIGIPYLVKYPPSHWSLVKIGDKLAPWIHEEYHGANKELVDIVAKLDWAFCYSFVAEQLPPINLEAISDEKETDVILSKLLYTQPHLHLLEMPFDAFKFRIEFLAHPPEFWQEHDWPKIEREKKYYFALYRNRRNEISWKEIAEGEFLLLKLFQKGSTIDDACDWLDGQSEELCQEAMQKLQEWFKDWTSRGWLGKDEVRYNCVDGK